MNHGIFDDISFCHDYRQNLILADSGQLNEFYFVSEGSRSGNHGGVIGIHREHLGNLFEKVIHFLFLLYQHFIINYPEDDEKFLSELGSRSEMHMKLVYDSVKVE